MATFYIKTFGCKVNQYESQVIRENFLKNGFIEAGCIDEADICVVNTCTVTSVSDRKSLRAIRCALGENSKCVIVTGCLVEDEALDLLKLKGVDFIIRNKDKHRIVEFVSHSAKRIAHSKCISGFKGHTRVFVKVQDGCDNACSYCKVRIVRGRSKSRVLKEIIDECENLIKNGTKEIVFTGICLGAYGRDLHGNLSLGSLIEEICKIDGIWRLRLSSIEPKDMDKDLIYEIQKQKRICKHIHMPFQSGDDYILRRMDRPYKRRDYLKIVNRLKDIIPDIAISTDIMVGFPGETEERFKNTLKFLKEVRPMRMHIFPFSKRKGTAAYNYKDHIRDYLKKERENILLRLGKEFAEEYMNKFLGKDVEVLVESKRSEQGYLQGYTDRYIRVYIDGPDSLKNQLVHCQPVRFQPLGSNPKPKGALFSSKPVP
jgi:threonylcarbamoyladenosine tRNA methylthiotransferase MtaB